MTREAGRGRIGGVGRSANGGSDTILRWVLVEVVWVDVGVETLEEEDGEFEESEEERECESEGDV